MSKRIARYARTNLLAVVALFVALGGTSYAAANLIDGSSIKPHSIPKNRLTSGAITSLKGAKGPKGSPGARGAAGATGAQGLTGDTGAPGSAVAYAHVNTDGSLDAANSKNVLSSRYAYGGPGYYYCLQVAVPFKNIVASADGLDSTIHIEVSKGDPFTSCNAGQVRGDASVEFNGGTKANPFWVVFN